MRGILLDELSIGSLVRRAVGTSIDGPWVVVGIGGDGVLSLEPLCGGDVVCCHVGSVYGIPLEGDLLYSLGFRRAWKERAGDRVWYGLCGGVRLTVSLRQRHGQEFCRRVALGGRVSCWHEGLLCLHELQRWWVDRVLLPYGIPLVLPMAVQDMPCEE